MNNRNRKRESSRKETARITNPSKIPRMSQSNRKTASSKISRAKKGTRISKSNNRISLQKNKKAQSLTASKTPIQKLPMRNSKSSSRSNNGFAVLKMTRASFLDANFAINIVSGNSMAQPITPAAEARYGKPEVA